MCIVANVDLVVVLEQPDVDLDARAAGGEGGIKGVGAPFIVVGVAGQRVDVQGQVMRMGKKREMGFENYVAIEEGKSEKIEYAC
jgi:hypothetical protein